MRCAVRGLRHDRSRLEIVLEGNEERLGPGDRAEQRQHEVGEDVASRFSAGMTRGSPADEMRSANVASISCGSYATSGCRSAAASISS